MDLSSSHQVPSGPMTRSRARALETEVTSLLSQFHFDEHETWLLPQTETLCILRYQGDSHGDAVEQGEPEEEDGRQEAEEKPTATEPAVLPRALAVLPRALAVLPRAPAVLPRAGGTTVLHLRSTRHGTTAPPVEQKKDTSGTTAPQSGTTANWPAVLPLPGTVLPRCVL